MKLIVYENQIDIKKHILGLKIIEENPNYKILKVNENDCIFCPIPNTKISTTIILSKILNEKKIESIILIGNTTSIINKIKLYSVAISYGSFQYDKILLKQFNKSNPMNNNQEYIYKSDTQLIKQAQLATQELGLKTEIGLFASADKIIIDNYNINRLKSQNVNFIDTQSGTIGEIANTYNIPFVIIKTVSLTTIGILNQDKNLEKNKSNEIALLVIFNMLKKNVLTPKKYLSIINQLKFENKIQISKQNQETLFTTSFKFHNETHNNYILCEVPKSQNIKPNNLICISLDNKTKTMFGTVIKTIKDLNEIKKIERDLNIKNRQEFEYEINTFKFEKEYDLIIISI